MNLIRVIDGHRLRLSQIVNHEKKQCHDMNCRQYKCHNLGK